VKLGKGAFVVLFPQDAHEPQICIDTPSPVKKIVVKIAIGNLQDTIR
jgi:YhcH/YjgK/YiaL family protein